VTTEKTHNYKDLYFWKNAFEVSRLCITLVRKLPKEGVSVVITNQLLRASASVGANVAEGYGRYGGKEYPRFLQVALGSANETEYWLLLLKDAYPILSDNCEMVINKNCNTIRMLTASLRTIRAKLL
jgi:four helix bundle protein